MASPRGRIQLSSEVFVSFAQNREDVVLHRALEGVTRGRYIDVGANDPAHESVTKAFKTMKPLYVPTMATPFTFGNAPAHTPNHAAFSTVLKDGKWVNTGHKLVMDYTK